jgi:hypothetical protein
MNYAGMVTIEGKNSLKTCPLPAMLISFEKSLSRITIQSMSPEYQYMDIITRMNRTGEPRNRK